MRHTKFLLSVMLVFYVTCGHVNADFITFDAVWSDPTGGPAMATAEIVIDDSILPNPGFTDFNSPLADAGIVSLEMVVVDAIAGNGSFSADDFGGHVWDTFGAALDLSTELVGQPTGLDPWGTSSGGGGDFNLFANAGSGAPSGTFFFELTTNEGFGGSTLLLSSFAPRAIPEPGSLAIISGFVGMLILRRRK